MNTLIRRLGLALTGVILVGLTTSTAEAFGRRSRCAPTCCWTSCDSCGVYTVSEPPVKIDGPFPTLVRKAQVGSGVIVEIIAPFAAPPHPTDTIVVTQIGDGKMRYTGYNICPVTPGLPGSPLRYSIFLCPVKAGDCEVFVDIYYTDTKAHRVPFRFAITSN